MIVGATPAHAEVMAAIHAGAFPARERWGGDAIAAQLMLHGVFGLIAPEGAMILARVIADEAEVLTLATMPPVRRRGLARALLGAAQDRSRASGAAAIYLEVAETNLAARALYAGLGYVEIGRRPRYYGESAALAMRLGL